jgi:hypothetical protein
MDNPMDDQWKISGMNRNRRAETVFVAVFGPACSALKTATVIRPLLVLIALEHQI